MYFSAAVYWTKASICSGCRLRHQLEIDFITHSNPQLGIANATLMRARNPKQVYIVFCPAVRGAAEMILTPTTFRRDFFLLHFSFSHFVDQMLQSQLTVHTKKRRLEGGGTQFGCSYWPFLKWATLKTDHHEATPMTSLRFVTYFFVHDNWQNWPEEESWWDRNLQHAPNCVATVSPDVAAGDHVFHGKEEGGW